MRRLLALLLIVLVPLQFAWSAAHAMHGHGADDVAALGLHSHDSDHGHDIDTHDDDHDDLASTGSTGDSPDGGNPGHYHPVFSPLVIEPIVDLPRFEPDGPPAWLPATFTSHIPPLFDRPPLARI